MENHRPGIKFSLGSHFVFMSVKIVNRQQSRIHTVTRPVTLFLMCAVKYGCNSGVGVILKGQDCSQFAFSSNAMQF